MQPHDDQKTWATLQKDIKAALPIRNQLAHSPVSNYLILQEDPEDESSIIIGVNHISITAQTEAYRKRGEQKTVERKDLDGYVAKLFDLQMRLRGFLLRVKAQLPIFHEQGFDDW